MNLKNKENKESLMRETSLNRLLNKHTDSGYAMVSACRNDWVPFEQEEEGSDEREVLYIKNQEMNNKKTAELKSDIYDSGFQYIPVRGGFIEQNSGVPKEEASFIIVNYKRRQNTPCENMDELKQLAIDLCGKYNQDSVLVVEPGKKPTYYKRDGSVDFEFSGGVTARDNAQHFYTRLGKGRKFTFLEGVEQPHTMNAAVIRTCRGEIVTYGTPPKRRVSETSRFQKAKKAFLGQRRNIRNFAIFSPENPMGERYSDSENAELRAQFEKVLRDGRFVYFPVNGRYGNVEHSYFIYNVNVETVKEWGSAEMFNQESFFICESNYDEEERRTGITFNYWKKDGDHKPFKLIESSDQWIDSNDQKDYFTAIGRTFKFSIAMAEFGNLDAVNEGYEVMRESIADFDRILDESIKKVGFNAWTKRAKIHF